MECFVFSCYLRLSRYVRYGSNRQLSPLGLREHIAWCDPVRNIAGLLQIIGYAGCCLYGTSNSVLI